MVDDGEGSERADRTAGKDLAADVPAVAATSSATLPNKTAFNGWNDTPWVRRFAAHVLAWRSDVRVDLGAVQAIWPTTGERRAVMKKVGTLVGTGDEHSTSAYYHDGLDILRSGSDGSVRAPVSGRAVSVTFDTESRVGCGEATYDCAVAILDDASRVIFVLGHVVPVAGLGSAGAEGIHVEQGETIGRISDVPGGVPDEEKIAHTHLTMIDASGAVTGTEFGVLGPIRILDAAKYLEMPDSIPPVVDDVYMTKNHARVSGWQTGDVDLVAVVHDMTDDSEYPLEPTLIGYRITDDTGRVLASMRACRTVGLMEDVPVLAQRESNIHNRVTDAFDLTTILSNVASSRGTSSDQRSLTRRFAYALTNLRGGPDGACAVVQDVAGGVRIGPQVKSLAIEVTVTDSAGHETTASRILRRPS